MDISYFPVFGMCNVDHFLFKVYIILGKIYNFTFSRAGAQGNQMDEERQWYVLWGLVPINEVDTNEMADGATDYEIKTETSGLDIVINIFTSVISVVSRTVTVTK